MNLRAMTRWTSVLLFVAVAAPRLAAAQDADGHVNASGGIRDTGAHTRPHMLSFFATIPYWSGWGFGLGARYQIPLAHDGFLPRVNDSFELEFGADLYYAGAYCYYDGCGFGAAGLTIPVEAMWTFHITPKFDAYGKLGLGVNFYFGRGFYVSGPFGPIWFSSGAGIMYHINESIYFRAELGWPTTRVGIGITL